MPEDARYVDNEFDRRVEQFDSAWRRGEIPSIADQLALDEHLNLDATLWPELLKELVMIDLEYRWRHADEQLTRENAAAGMQATRPQIPRHPCLEDYLAIYPDLGPLERLSTELIASEYRARHRWGDRPTHQEFVHRFPRRGGAVRRALERVDARLPRSSKLDGLRIRCPHCHESIDVDDRDLVGNLTCLSCERRFSLVDDDRCNVQSGEVQRVGNIELLKRLGSGSFGTVWKSRDTQLDRLVAVKLPHQSSFDATQREQFLREARATAQLNHPNIISVHEVGREGDRLYIVTDLVRGVNLADWLTEHRSTPREAAGLCAKLADALEHAHQQGVIHRDLKPSNIMLDTDGEPHLGDFGLAKREAGEVTMTVEGKLLGTPTYMPPEQARGSAHDADCRSDIYSLGVILFELLTGERPFGGSTDVLLQRIMFEDAISPRRLSQSIPQDLETICLKCLEKDPDQRYQTATTLRDELWRFLHGKPVQARPITRMARTGRWCKRNPMVAILGTTVGSLLLFLAVAGQLVALSQTRLATREATARAREATARAREATAREDLRRQLYVADMNVARHALEGGNVGRSLDLLAKHRPSSDEEDLRQFEWYHLWKLCQGGLMFFDHESPIFSATFAPDGQELYTGGSDGRIKVWNVDTGKLTNTLNAHRGTVASLAFSPDGTTLASGGDAIKFWRGNPIQQTGEFHVDEGITSLVFSPDGMKIATSHVYGSVILWDTSSMQQIDSQTVNHSYILNVAFSPDGKMLAFATRNGRTISLWNIETGEWTDLKASAGDVYAVAFSPDGKFLAAGGKNSLVSLWDVASGEIQTLLTGHRSGVISLSFSADGKMLASAGRSGDATVNLWDLTTYEKTATLIGHSGGIFEVFFSPTDQTVATASFDGTARLWDLTNSGNGKILTGHSDQIRDMAFSRDGEMLLSASDDGTVRLWNVESGDTHQIIKTTMDDIMSSSFSEDEKTIAAGDSKGTVALIDVATGTERVLSAHHTDRVMDMTFSPDSQMMASSSKDDRVMLWDVKTGYVLHVFDALSEPGEFGGVAFSPTENILAYGDCEGTVKLWDVDTFSEIGQLLGHSSGIRSVTFSRDGRLLAAGGDDMTAIVWNVATRAVQQQFVGHSGPVWSVGFFADGATLITGGLDESVRLWEVATGRERCQLNHGAWVLCTSISPNGQILASAGPDQRIKLWRAATVQDVQAAGEWWNR